MEPFSHAITVEEDYDTLRAFHRKQPNFAFCDPSRIMGLGFSFKKVIVDAGCSLDLLLEGIIYFKR